MPQWETLMLMNCRLKFRRTVWIFVLGMLVQLLQLAHAARVYRWVDDSGKIYFADQPQPPAQKQRAEEMIVSGPARQPEMDENQQQQRANAEWFDQRSVKRQAQELERQKARAKRAKIYKKKREICRKARYKFEDAKAEFRVKKRAGLKVQSKAKLKARLATYEADMKRKC